MYEGKARAELGNGEREESLHLGISLALLNYSLGSSSGRTHANW